MRCRVGATGSQLIQQSVARVRHHGQATGEMIARRRGGETEVFQSLLGMCGDVFAVFEHQRRERFFIRGGDRQNPIGVRHRRIPNWRDATRFVKNVQSRQF